jgi:hypothetical protein
MKTVLIGTTAINRPLLHNDNIPDWYIYINSLDKSQYNIVWFINVDYIPKLESTVQETIDNFSNIIIDIPISVIQKQPDQLDGNFFTACKSVSVTMEQYVIDNKLNIDDVIVFWLEDDWKLNPKNIPLQELIENYLSNLTYINLSFIRLNYIHALAPSIISYQLWSQLHLQAWKKQIDHIDPEHCVGQYYINNFCKYDNLYNITVINQYKQHNKNWFNMTTGTAKTLLKSDKSYYTYDVEKDENFILDKYIEKKEIKEFFKDKITFIRITCSSCSGGVNYGRNFMKQYDITKRKIQNNNNLEFYK